MSLQQGIVSLQQGNVEEAIGRFQQAIIADIRNPQGYFLLAQALEAKAQWQDALQNYVRAAKLQPGWAEPLKAAWDLLMQQGRAAEALPFAVQLCLDNPQSESAWNCYQACFSQLPQYYEVEKALAPAIEVALKGVMHHKLRAAVLRQVVFSPWMQRMSALTVGRDHDAFEGAVYEALAQPELLREITQSPLLPLMQRTTIPQVSLEWVLTQLRRRFLLGMQAEERQAHLSLLMSLWALCFNNEYVFFAQEDEREALEALRQRLAGSVRQVSEVALLGCYFPLAAEPFAEELLALNPPDLLPEQVAVLHQCVEEQIAQPLNERARRAQIPVLQGIADETSHRVREQYEAAPYPRWREDPKMPPLGMRGYRQRLGAKPYWLQAMAGEEKQVLVAGSGTGRHPISLAQSLPQCEVLAVDISLSSLAYAQRKAEEIGIGNLRFMQADILDLQALGQSFDHIESAGVLHHMKDPMAGWQVLTEILKPGGTMRIGLYSKLARRAIIAARAEIAERKLGRSDDAIRQFRREVMRRNNEGMRELFRAADFFSLSECRDLIFHVQEHQFTWPQIGDCVKKLGLNFCGVQLTENPVLHSFEAGLPKLADEGYFEQWHRFEQMQPHSFSGMYHFWLQKPLT